MNNTEFSSPAAFTLAHEDKCIGGVLESMRQLRNVPANDNERFPDPHHFPTYGFSIDDMQGNLMYMLCRAIGARRVVDFATSIGISAIYLAAAVRDNGGGTVIGAELVEAKHAKALENLSKAGLGQYADIRLGDARQTLRDLEAPLDFVLIDSWPYDQTKSLAREMIEILTPKLRSGAIVINDNGEKDYLEFVRANENGFRSLSLPINRGTEFSIKI